MLKQGGSKLAKLTKTYQNRLAENPSPWHTFQRRSGPSGDSIYHSHSSNVAMSKKSHTNSGFLGKIIYKLAILQHHVWLPASLSMFSWCFCAGRTVFWPAVRQFGTLPSHVHVPLRCWWNHSHLASIPLKNWILDITISIYIYIILIHMIPTYCS